MKIQYLRYYLLILCIHLTISIGCTTENTTNPVDPTESSEVVLENHQLTENETWTPEKTYIVKGTLEIPQDVTLNIPPGTTVKFGRNALLTVRGILKVGTPLAQEQVTELVHLTSENIKPAPADWNGILFDHTHDLESFIRGTSHRIRHDRIGHQNNFTDCGGMHTTSERNRHRFRWQRRTDPTQRYS